MRFLILSHKHIFLTLFNQKSPENKYTRKQPTHFSMALLRPKLKKKKFFEI